MSLILDALNRSERERGTDGSVPNLATEHYLDATASGSGWRRHLPWLALMVAVLIIGWLLWERFDKEDGDTARQVRPAATADTPAGQGPAPSAAARTGQPLASSDAVAAAAPTKTAEPPAAVASAKSAEPPAAETPAPTSRPAPPQPELSTDVSNLYQQGSGADTATADPAREADAAAPAPAEIATAPTVIAEPVSEENLDLEALVTRAENELENARLAEHPAPFLADLSQQKKNQIPTLMYSRHDYASNAKAATVTINGKSLRAGGSAGGGVRVVEVLPDSVVLSHQGTEFRLRALNSWVNL